jgi:hypothetical protein
MYFNGAKFMESRHWNPDHPEYRALLNTPTTTSISGSKSSKRVKPPDTTASVLAETSIPKRPRNRVENKSTGSSSKAATIATTSGNNPDQPGSLFKNLKQSVLNSINDLAVSDQEAAYQSQQASMYAGPHPNITDTTQQGKQSERYSQSECEELGNKMLKDGAETFYKARRPH